jgi:hypothetical protein
VPENICVCQLGGFAPTEVPARDCEPPADRVEPVVGGEYRSDRLNGIRFSAAGGQNSRYILRMSLTKGGDKETLVMESQQGPPKADQ